MENTDIANQFREIARLLDIQGGERFRIKAYLKAAAILDTYEPNAADVYRDLKTKKNFRIPGIGEKNIEKIKEFIKNGKIKRLEELKEKTALQQLVTFFFETKGVELEELKRNARKRNIVYSRYTKPAKQLLELSGSIDAAKEAVKRVANWANSRKLDYTIETVLKRWPELETLKPKESVKKPFYRNDPMIWSETRKKWFVITKAGEWLEYADKEEKIEWRIID